LTWFSHDDCVPSQRAIYLKQLRRKVQFQWSNACIIAAFSQWCSSPPILALHPAPYTLHPSPSPPSRSAALSSEPYSLPLHLTARHPTPCTLPLYPASLLYTLHPTPFASSPLSPLLLLPPPPYVLPSTPGAYQDDRSTPISTKPHTHTHMHTHTHTRTHARTHTHTHTHTQVLPVPMSTIARPPIAAKLQPPKKAPFCSLCWFCPGLIQLPLLTLLGLIYSSSC